MLIDIVMSLSVLPIARDAIETKDGPDL